MAPKLKEMDDIIKEIHMQSIIPQKNSNSQTLLVCDLEFFNCKLVYEVFVS